MEDKRNWYVVCEGYVQELPHEHLALMQYDGEDYALREAADDLAGGTYGITDRYCEDDDTIYARAKSADEALHLARLYDAGKIQPDNVWCNICGKPHVAVSMRHP